MEPKLCGFVEESQVLNKEQPFNEFLKNLEDEGSRTASHMDDQRIEDFIAKRVASYWARLLVSLIQLGQMLKNIH